MTSNKRLYLILSFCLVPLIFPLIAMNISEEVNWSLFDFIIAGFLLLLFGLFIEIILRKVKKTKNKIVFIALLFLIITIVWLELAVGIIGSPFAGS